MGERESLSGIRSRSGEGLGWDVQFLAQSFLRGNGAPVSTWQIPVRRLLKIRRKNGQKEGGSEKDSGYWPKTQKCESDIGGQLHRDGVR